MIIYEAEKMNEVKHDNFKRLAKARINKALFAINQLGKLASSNYHCTEEEFEQVASALTISVEAMKTAYTEKKAPAMKFSFADGD